MIFVLIHSPSVGPATWRPVAAELRRGGHQVLLPDLRPVAAGPAPYRARVLDAVLGALAAAGVVEGDAPELVMVPHSNAGHFVPLIASSLPGRVRGQVFVDAALPPPDGETALAEEDFLPFLEQRARGGILPPWTQWWHEHDVAPLFAGVGNRAEVEAEQPRLPLDYYTERVPVPSEWVDVPGAYLWFGPPYDVEAAEAARRGWPVRRVPGLHLHLLVDPVAVAAEIAGLTP
ncbi:MAG: hypothetical protein JNL54_04050 [Kineosporiaceae bacterium]|nr:hypothetical protein [Kineosporiaceae bacterium]